MKYLNDINYRDCISKVCKSKSSGDFKIVKYNDTTNVEIQFVNTGFETVATLDNIRKGYVKDPYVPSVYGIGVSGAKYSPTISGRNTKEYDLWKSMLRRCYSDDFKKKHPTYKDCEVSENFNYYEYFYDWCQNQIGFGNDGFELDKDLLIKGNKVYSEDSCVFIPVDVNLVLTKHTSLRGEYLIGVSWSKTHKAFISQVCKSKGKREYLGLFKTEIEAFNAYKIAKESYLKDLADKWKDKIDGRAYEALMSYQVEITD